MPLPLRSRKPGADPAESAVMQRTKSQARAISVRACFVSLVAVTAVIMIASSRAEIGQPAVRHQVNDFGWRMWGTAGYLKSSIVSGPRQYATSEEIQYHKQLFQSLVKQRAIDNEIILTVGTSDYKDLVLNLVCSFRKVNATNYVIGALDNQILAQLEKLRLPVYAAYALSELGGFELRSGVISSRNFNQANLVKNEVVIRALQMGYRVISTDSDIVWLRNPLSYLRTFADNLYDIVFQCDSELSASNCHICAGFYYANSTSYAIKTFQWLVETKLKDPSMRDQLPLKRFLCHHRLSSHTCLAANNATRISMLPRKLFPAGYAVNQFADNVDTATIMSWDPYLLHFNWNDGGHSLKIQLMKKSGFWLLNSENKCELDI